MHMEPGVRYCLLPRPWLASWRAFVNGGGGKRGPPGSDLQVPGTPPMLLTWVHEHHAFQASTSYRT